jgi:predicted acetyltransferase
MTTLLSTVAPPQHDAELEEFALILSDSLNFPPREEIDFMTRYRVGDMRLVRRRGRVAGGLTLLPCGQFFGGQRLPMVGVHAVAIAPEARGTRVGRELMTEVVREMAAPGGPPIAVLFPATQPIYRSVGFEQAGTFTRYRIPVSTIPIGPHDLEVERVPPDPVAAAVALSEHYARAAQRENGLVDRTHWFWQRAVDPLNHQVTTFAVREEGAITGHVILSRRWFTQGAPHTELVCREMVAETATSARRLWTLLADERSLARSLLINGPPVAAEQLFFAEQTPEVDWQVRWMLRILNVEAALTGRGYLAGLEREVAFEVEDELVAENRGRFALAVAGGRGTVERGGAGRGGAVRLGIRALAALFTGYLGAEQLARAGMASGDADALAAATAVFAGAPPWLPEIF